MRQYLNMCFVPIAWLLVSCSGLVADVTVVEKESPVVQGEVLSQNIGIETLGGVLTPILKSGCKLPCQSSQIFSTAENDQNQITITLVRGDAKLSRDGVLLGKYQLTGIAAAPRGVPQIKVVFGASKGQIWISVSDVKEQSVVHVTKIP